MSWLESIYAQTNPGAFTGTTFGDWFQILRRAHFAIDPPYWVRAALISGNSLPNTALRWLESALFGRAIDQASIEPPIFILGCWRSGTTHLHNLLSLDDRFAYPNQFQVLFPHSFLLTERALSWLYGRVIPKTRPQDNVYMGINMPQEDEFALVVSGQSAMLSMVFPRLARDYDRLLALRDMTDDELQVWKQTLLHFLKKLSYHYQRPLVLKSPGHTGRIRVLLQLFPDARFVHIRRNPYDLYQSTEHTIRKIAPWWALQRHRFDVIHTRVIEQYRELYDAYFDDRPLIANDCFCEVAFEALEQDPVRELSRVYEALRLPDFNSVEPGVRAYLNSISDYRKNEFPPLADELKTTISHEWHRSFEAWGYPT